MADAPLLPGYKLINEGRYSKRCSQCKAPVMMARLNERGQRWAAFEPSPIEGTIRHYRIHWCPATVTYLQGRNVSSGEPPQQGTLL